MKATEVEQGGLSDEVFYSDRMREYLAQCAMAKGETAFGYVGSHRRNLTKDSTVEAALRALGLTDDEIADVIASAIGRHLATDLEPLGARDRVQIKYEVTAFVRRFRGDIGRLIGRTVEPDEAAKRVASIKAYAAALVAEAEKLERQVGANPLALDMLKKIDVALDAVHVATF